MEHYTTPKVLVWMCLICPVVSTLYKDPSSRKSGGIATHGNIMLGGLFAIHFGEEQRKLLLNEAPQVKSCVRFSTIGFHQAMVMLFSINEVNYNVLLPNITLGFVIHDSCHAYAKTLEASLQLIKFMAQESHKASPCSFQAVIGPAPSALSVMSNRLLGLSNIPQVSYNSICKCLSDKSQFPSFLRTSPQAVHIVSGIVHLMQYFGWLYVGSVAVDDDYGRAGQAQFLQEAERNGICIAFHELLPRAEDTNYHKFLVNIIGDSKTKVVWLYMAYTSLYPLAEELLRRNLSDKIWIADAPWISSHLIGAPRFAQIFQGTIGINIRRGEIPGLRSFLENLSPSTENLSDVINAPNIRDSLNDFVLELWEETFNCTWDVEITEKDFCTGHEQLGEVNSPFTDVSELRESYSVYMAVHAVAHALHDLHTCELGQSPFVNGSCVNLFDFEPWQLLFYLRNVQFRNNLGQKVYFDENGDFPSIYDLINWKNDGQGGIKFKVVGGYDPVAPQNQKLFVEMNSVSWNKGETKIPSSVCNEPCQPGYRKVSYPGQPFCCYDCISCTDGEYSNKTDSQKCKRCPKYFWSTAIRDNCVPMPEEFMTFSEPLALSLLAFAVFGIVTTLVIWTFLFCHRKISIMKGQVAQLLLFALAGSFSCTIAFIGRPINLTCQIRRPVSCLFLLFTVICVLIMTVLLFSSTADKPVQNDVSNTLKIWSAPIACLAPQIALTLTWAFVGQPRKILNTQARPGTILLECGGESPAWAACNFTCLGVVAALCLGLATKAQKLPSAYNEAKFINFSMLTFFIVALAFVPANSSTQGKLKVATEIFAIIAVASSFLVSIFMPKCYAVVFNRND